MIPPIDFSGHLVYLRPPDPRDCAYSCPGGGHCKLDGRIGHTLHICGDPACACHSQQRYEEAKQQRRAARKALQTIEVLPW